MHMSPAGIELEFPSVPGKEGGRRGRGRKNERRGKGEWGGGTGETEEEKETTLQGF